LLRWLSFSKKLKKLFVDVLVCLVFKDQFYSFAQKRLY
jgi:hypothetical protein